MADLTITVPDPQVPRILEAFAERVGKDVGDMVAEDVRQELINLIKIIVHSYEQRVAEEAIVITDVTPT